ncbi:hypothetical protein DM860_004320 [Cuscuta australis]|uniref:Uncharacterized protein n=1 Tax=Cuscuta australis TaxID=267555 RepID=A0A328EBB7_9ASTE|nr:hypothetical protein DM860_004320 [Cuscuta australis]
MPHRARPMAGLLLFVGLNAALVSTIEPVYDFVCFLPYWERRVSFLFHPPYTKPFLLTELILSLAIT